MITHIYILPYTPLSFSSIHPHWQQIHHTHKKMSREISFVDPKKMAWNVRGRCSVRHHRIHLIRLFLIHSHSQSHISQCSQRRVIHTSFILYCCRLPAALTSRTNLATGRSRRENLPSLASTRTLHLRTKPSLLGKALSTTPILQFLRLAVSSQRSTTSPTTKFS